MRKALLVATLCLTCGSAIGADDDQAPWSASTIYDGAKLLVTHPSPADLTEDQKAQAALAYGWLLGVESTLEASGLEAREKAMICVPLPPTPNELARQYVAYVDAHEDARKYNAASLLMDALRMAHPCK